MAYLNHALKKLIESSNTEEVIRCGIAAFLLTGIFLPNTTWALFSIQQLLPWLTNISSARPLPYYSIVSYILGVIILSTYYMPFNNPVESHILTGIFKSYNPKPIAIRGYWACFLFLIWLLAEYGVAGNKDIACLSAFNYLCIGLAAVKLCNNTKHFFKLIVCLGTVQAVYTIWYYINSVNTLISGTVPRAGGLYNNPQQIYSIMLFCIPCALALALTSLRMKWLWYICLTVLSISILATWFRGGILGASIGLAYFFYRYVSKKQILIPIALALIIAAAYPFIYRSDGPVNTLSTSRSISGRYNLWNTGFHLLKQNWVTGIGLHQTKMPVTTSTGKAQVFTHPLNLYLHILIELGIRGAILLCLGIIGAAHVLRHRQTYAMEEGSAIGAVWISILVAGLFDTPILTTGYLITYTVFGAFYGMTLACNQCTCE